MIRDELHALVTGQVMGSLMKAGMDVEPILGDGNYTEQIRVKREDGSSYRVLVVPEKDAD